MTQLVLVILSGLHTPRRKALVFLNVDLDLTADTSRLIVILHEVVELLKGVVVRPRSNVEHERVLGLQVLAGALEEPLVGVDLSIVALLDAEHEVDSATLQNLVLDTEVPRRALETMQEVRWDVGFWHALVHYVTHLLHLEIAIAVRIHEPLLEEHLLVKEAFVASQLLELRLQVLVAIDDDTDEEVVLRKVRLGVDFQTIVVVKAACQSIFQFLNILIVHGDADG